MDRYNFTVKQKRLLLSGIFLGILCLFGTWMIDDELHTRFWSNLLHNAVFFTGIGLMAAFFLAVCITAWAGWISLFKRVWEAYSMFLVVGLVLMIIIGLGNYFHWHHLYHWTDEAAVANDEILQLKSSFLNKNWYFFGTLVFMGAWIFIMNRIRQLSLKEDQAGDSSFSHHHKIRIWAAMFLPIAGFTSAAVVWLWIMSVDAHWYSTLFAWYSATSWFIAMICLTIIMLIFLKSKGYMQNVNNEHIHDLGKYLFAFSIFWTYLWFSQYMLIWYGNVGEETVYFQTRHQEYPVLFWGNLLINFVLPFFVLMRNDTKRKFGSIGFISGVVFFGHWWDFFQMIKPGVIHTAQEALHGAEHAAEAGAHGAEFAMGFTIPGLLEIGTLIGFLCVFLYFVYSVMSRSALVPKNDPYLAESIHHHV